MFFFSRSSSSSTIDVISKCFCYLLGYHVSKAIHFSLHFNISVSLFLVPPVFSNVGAVFCAPILHFVNLDEPKRDAKILKKTYRNLLCLEMVIYLFFILWLLFSTSLLFASLLLLSFHISALSDHGEEKRISRDVFPLD